VNFFYNFPVPRGSDIFFTNYIPNTQVLPVKFEPNV